MRSECLYIRRKNHLFHALAELPAPYDLIGIVLVLDGNPGKAGLFKNCLQFLHGNRAGNSTAVGIFILPYFFGEFPPLEDVGDRNPAARL
jgi:hypothetical protein